MFLIQILIVDKKIVLWTLNDIDIQTDMNNNLTCNNTE